MSPSWARNVANSKNRVSLDTVLLVADALHFEIFLHDAEVEGSYDDRIVLSKAALDKHLERMYLPQEERKKPVNELSPEEIDSKVAEFIKQAQKGEIDKIALLSAIERYKLKPGELDRYKKHIKKLEQRKNSENSD